MSLYYSLGSLESSHLAKWSHQSNNDLILILILWSDVSVLLVQVHLLADPDRWLHDAVTSMDTYHYVLCICNFIRTMAHVASACHHAELHIAFCTVFWRFRIST